MRSPTNTSILVRGAIVALVVVVAAGLLFGPVGVRPEPQSAEAAFLSEVKKLLASDAAASDNCGYSVALRSASVRAGLPRFRGTRRRELQGGDRP